MIFVAKISKNFVASKVLLFKFLCVQRKQRVSEKTRGDGSREAGLFRGEEGHLWALLSDGSNRTRRNSMELSHRRVRLDVRKGFCTTGWSGTGKVKAEAHLKNNELTERKLKGTTNTLSFLLLLFKNSKVMLYCLNNWLCFQTVQNQTH